MTHPAAQSLCDSWATCEYWYRNQLQRPRLLAWEFFFGFQCHYMPRLSGCLFNWMKITTYFATKLRRSRNVSRISVFRSARGYVMMTESPLCMVRTVRIICLPFWLTTTRRGVVTSAVELLGCWWLWEDVAPALDALSWLALERRGLFMQLSLAPIIKNKKQIFFCTEFWNTRSTDATCMAYSLNEKTFT